MAVAARKRAGSPYVAFGYLALAMVLLVVMLPTSLRPPPDQANAAAEFSPDAPPDEQQDSIVAALQRASSATAGSGEGDGPPNAAGSGTTVAPDLPSPPRTRRCFGSPPRQIEDPQSPPCAPYWAGDNGGATSQGVTATEIRVGVPKWSDDFHPIMEQFFNERFEFYGRQMRLVKMDVKQSGGTPAEAQADAAKADSQYDVFASTEYSANNHFAFHTELGRRGVVSTVFRPLYGSSTLREHSPYLWQYTRAADELFAELGRWACARLAGRPAQHAGEGISGRRVFGIVLQENSAGAASLDTSALEAALGECGEQSARTVVYGAASYADPQMAANGVVQMRQAGVTSVFCLCHIQGGGILANAAEAQGWNPEWLVSSYLYQDTNWGVKLYWPSSQRRHAFGLTFLPKQVNPRDNPARWAVLDADPESNVLTSSQNGDDTFKQRTDMYRQLLLIASGIQLAGPRLTPESFASGLHRTTFPNPPMPIMAGKVGFAGRSYSMTTDAAEIWWSDAAPDPFPNTVPGAFCYVRRGARTDPGQWAGDEAFFAGDCDSGASPAGQ